MITINKIQDKFNTNPLFLFGLSSDEKPTDRFNGLKVVNGSEYTEVDTGKKYRFDESNVNWVEFSEGGGGTAGGNMDYVNVVDSSNPLPPTSSAKKGDFYLVGEDGVYTIGDTEYYTFDRVNDYGTNKAYRVESDLTTVIEETEYIFRGNYTPISPTNNLYIKGDYDDATTSGKIKSLLAGGIYKKSNKTLWKSFGIEEEVWLPNGNHNFGWADACYVVLSPVISANKNDTFLFDGNKWILLSTNNKNTNMDYGAEITIIPSPSKDLKGKVYTIGADGDYSLEPKYYYVQKNWDILSKYDSLNFSGEPLATYPTNNTVPIDGIIMFKDYEWTYGLVEGYAIYDSTGIKNRDLPLLNDDSVKLSIYQYITKSSDTVPLRKGDTIICDGEKWIPLNTNQNEHSKGSIHSIGYWGSERAYEGCFEVTGTSWSGSKMFSLSSFISGYTGASKVIDYSVLLKLDGGGFVKSSMVGSGMDISAYLTNNNTLSIYTSATVSSVIFCIQYIP